MSKQKIAKYQRYLAEIEKLSDEQMQELSKEIFRRDDIPKEAIKRRISVLRQAEDFGFRGSEISKLDSFFERIASDSHFGESRTSDVSSSTSPKSLGSSGVGSESGSEAATRSALSAPLSERSSDSEGVEDEERGGPFTAEDIKEVENLTEEEIEKLSLEIMFSVVDKDTLLEYLQGEHDLEEISKVREFISDSRARARSKISEEEKILIQFDKDKAKFKRYGIELPVFEVKLPAGFLEEFGPLVEKYSTHEGKSSVVFKGGKLSGGFARMNLMASKDCFEKAGGCDPLIFIQDESLPIRLAAKAKAAIKLNEVIAYVPKIKDDNLSNNKSQQNHDRFFSYFNFWHQHPKEARAIENYVYRKMVGSYWKYLRDHSIYQALSTKAFWWYLNSKASTAKFNKQIIDQIHNFFSNIEDIRRV